jgi:hypothetical protein
MQNRRETLASIDARMLPLPVGADCCGYVPNVSPTDFFSVGFVQTYDVDPFLLLFSKLLTGDQLFEKQLNGESRGVRFLFKISVIRRRQKNLTTSPSGVYRLFLLSGAVLSRKKRFFSIYHAA